MTRGYPYIGRVCGKDSGDHHLLQHVRSARCRDQESSEIPIIPFVIRTEEGVFKDGVHIDAYELSRYISSGHDAVSDVPSEADYTEFFAETLKKAHHIIHIAITASMSREYEIASEAARSFDNVSVINSEVSLKRHGYPGAYREQARAAGNAGRGYSTGA